MTDLSSMPLLSSSLRLGRCRLSWYATCWMLCLGATRRRPLRSTRYRLGGIRGSGGRGEEENHGHGWGREERLRVGRE